MLGKADATPMIAVKDLDRARRFYEEKLGPDGLGRRPQQGVLAHEGGPSLGISFD